MIYIQKDLVLYCEENGKTLADIVLEDEVKFSKRSAEELRQELGDMLDVMERSATYFLESSSHTTMNLITGFTEKLENYSKTGKGILSGEMIHLLAMAFSTMEMNASMGKIVAAPTAGAAGIVPASLMFYKQKHGATKDELIDGLLTATGVGQIIGRYANFAGAEGGCQAECGSAGAMAAGALVHMHGGNTNQILTAASIALLNVMGLVCDPIGGIVEFPCGFRNASGATNALISAEMALAGLISKVPFEQVAGAMKEVGDALPTSLRETGLGGIAGTDVGVKIREEFFKKGM